MLKDLRVGLAITGSFCNFAKIAPQIELLKTHGIKEILPIASFNTLQETNRFSTQESIRKILTEETGKEIIDTISKAEPVGPKDMVDIIVIAPCTGNTLAKLASGIADTAVTMAAKSHLRNKRPVLIAVSTNDGLGGAAKNIGQLMNYKNIFFVPFRQDDCVNKENSLIADFNKIPEAARLAIKGKQMQPIIIN